MRFAIIGKEKSSRDGSNGLVVANASPPTDTGSAVTVRDRKNSFSIGQVDLENQFRFYCASARVWIAEHAKIVSQKVED